MSKQPLASPSLTKDEGSSLADLDHKTSSSDSTDSLPVEIKISSHEVTLQILLKTGGYAVLHRGLWQGQPVAVKQFTPFTAGDNAQDFLQEAKIMHQMGLASPYVMALKAVCLDHYWLIMELMPCSLDELLKSKQELSWSARYQIALDISYGLRDLHARGILHRDLKSLNILLTPDLRAKLTDFGLAKLKDKTLTQSGGSFPKGTAHWMAPELLPPHGTRWTMAADIYSLGVVLWELVTRKMPFQHAIDKDSKNFQEAIPEDCPPSFKSLIKACWRKNPAKRPTAAQVAQQIQIELLLQTEKEQKDEKEKGITPLPLPLKEDYWALTDFSPALEIQRTIEEALQKGLSFPNFRSVLWGAKEKEEKTPVKKTSPIALQDWQLFWAAAEACETVLCSPQSTYTQQRQAMGDWIGQAHDQQVNLASLIEYGLNLPRYQQPECVEVLVQVFHRLLNPATPLPFWVRHLARYGWERLNQPIEDPETKELRSRLKGDYALLLKKNIDHWQALEEKTPQVVESSKLVDTVVIESQLIRLISTPSADFSRKLLSTPEEKQVVEKKKTTEEKLESLPSKIPTDEFTASFQGKAKDKSASWFKQVADWLNTQLPPPPCIFNPFVMVITTGKYQLGIELTDGVYRPHPFFSHWAECFRLCVGSFSEFACELDISAVSYFSQEHPSSFLLDGIGTYRELVSLTTTPPSTHWRYQASPMVHFDTTRRPLDLHSRLPLPKDMKDQSQRRPHAMAKGRQWQHHLLALTTDNPIENKPVAQLVWPGTPARYLSSALTRRLFYTEGEQAGQLASATRSQTPGQCDVWRLTAADTVQFLPEYPDETILAYVKVYPQNPWRQWQYMLLAERLIDYGHTGALATLCYGQVIEGKFQPAKDTQPIPVWLSSPAGLTFCNEAEAKDISLSADIQLLDQTGEARFKRCLAQLDPRCLSQAVFLTWLLVHEDDQLRNLGFEAFINAQGEGAFRVIAFDTDTALEAPWIRREDGRIQIKLKSLLLCVDDMQRPIDESARQDFLALEPETVLIDWLKPLAEIKLTENRLPPKSIEHLYRRWQRLRQVLQLPIQVEDPMAPTLPCSHLELLTMLDPPLGGAYQAAFETHTSPFERFAQVSKPDYLSLGGMSVSASSGLLRGHSLAQSRDKTMPLLKLTPREALVRCESYRQDHVHLKRLLTYLKQQAERTSTVDPLFKQQMTLIVGEIQTLNQQTQVQLEHRLQYKSRLERMTTCLNQWEPLTQAGLSVEIILPGKTPSLSLMAWQTACVQQAQAGIRLVKEDKEVDGAWRLWIHNGNYLLVETQWSGDTGEYKGEWDLNPLQKCVIILSPDPLAVWHACCEVYQRILLELPPIRQALLDSEAELQRLAEAHQALLFAQSSSETEAWHALKETDPLFLTGLLDVTLRQAIINQLPWGSLPPGKGVQQLLRLLELGGLSELNLQGCHDVTGAHLIACLQNSPDLLHLNISDCKQLTSRTLNQCALSATSLLRLSARQLLGLTDLWRGAIWLTRSPLVFPRLTHADFRGCVNLTRIYLQAPELQYLHLGQCASSTGRLSNTQDWILTTPKLKVLSLQGCQSLARLKIDTHLLVTIDARGSSLSLSLSKAMLKPEQWASVQRIQLSENEMSHEWKYLGDWPFLIPLAQQWMNADELLALHNLFTRQPLADEIQKLPAAGRWRLQRGLMLFLWQQPQAQAWMAFYLSLLRDSKKAIRHAALQAIEQILISAPSQTEKVFSACLPLSRVTAQAVGWIAAFAPSLAGKALSACLPLLKNSNYSVRCAAAKAIEKIAAASPEQATQALAYCLSLLKDSHSGGYRTKVQDIHRTAVEIVRQIAVFVPEQAATILSACLSLLNNSDWEVRRIAAQAVGQIVAYAPGQAAAALSNCLSLLKDSSGKACYAVLQAIEQIAASTSAFDQLGEALFACLSLLKDPDKGICRAALRAVGQIAASVPKQAEEALSVCLPLLKDSDSNVRSAAFRAVEQIATSNPAQAGEVLSACLSLLKDSNESVRCAALQVIGQIADFVPGRAAEALSACLPLLKDSALSFNFEGYAYCYGTGVVDKIHFGSRDKFVFSYGAQMVEQIVTSSPELAERALFTCLSLLKDPEWRSRIPAIQAVGQIVAFIPTHAVQALTACLPLFNDPDRGVRCTTLQAVEQIVAFAPAHAARVLTACLPLLKDSEQPVRHNNRALEVLTILPLFGNCEWPVRRHAIGLIGRITPYATAHAARALSACLPFPKDSYWVLSYFKGRDWEFLRATVHVVGQIGASSPGQASVALSACLPLLKYSYKGCIRSYAVQAVDNIIFSNPILIDRLLETLAILLEGKDPSIRLDALILFMQISSKYQIFFGQTLGEYVEMFLRKWFTDYPVESTSITEFTTSKADALSTATKATTSSIPARPALSALTTRDGKRCVVKNGEGPTALLQILPKPAESKQAIPSDAKFFLHEQKLIRFRRRKVSPDGNCLFHSMAYGIKHLTPKVQAEIRTKLEVKERSGSELKDQDINDQLLRRIAVKLLNEKVEDAKLAQDLVEQGLVPLATLNEKEYEDVLKSMAGEDKEGKLCTTLNSIRSAIAEKKDEKAYQTLVTDKAMEWATFYRDLLGLPNVWGGPVELIALENYLGIRFDLRQQFNLGPLPERLVKHTMLEKLLKQDQEIKSTVYSDCIKIELKAALSQLALLTDKERKNLVDPQVIKLLEKEKVLAQISKKNDTGTHDIDVVKLNAYLATPDAIFLYCAWFRIRKVLNSSLEQTIHDQCLLDKYSAYGLNQDTLQRIRQKQIEITEVYCSYNTPRLQEVIPDRRIQVVYTGAHYDIVESLPDINPIPLQSAEDKTSAIPLSSLPPRIEHPASETIVLPSVALSSTSTAPLTQRRIVTGSQADYQHLRQFSRSKAPSALRNKTILEEKLRILEYRKYTRLGQAALDEELGRLAKLQGLGVDEDDTIDENSDDYQEAAVKSEVLRYVQRKCGWDIDSLQSAASWYGVEMSRMLAVATDQAVQQREGLLAVQTSSISSQMTLAEMVKIREELLAKSSSSTALNPLPMLGLVSGAWGAGSGSHFGFNLIIEGTLIVLDPLGGDKVVKSAEARAAIQAFCQEQKITNVVIVQNKLQRDAEQKDQPESACGPISVALAQTFFSLGAAKVREWLHALSRQETIKIAQGDQVFQYQSADLISLLQEKAKGQGLVSLVHLTRDKDHPVNPDYYNADVAELRKQHTAQRTAAKHDSPLQALLELRLNVAAGYIESEQVLEARQQETTYLTAVQQCFLADKAAPPVESDSLTSAPTSSPKSSPVTSGAFQTPLSLFGEALAPASQDHPPEQQLAQAPSVSAFSTGYGRFLGSIPQKTSEHEPSASERLALLNKELDDTKQRYAEEKTSELSEKIKNLLAEIEKLKLVLSSSSTAASLAG